MSTKIGVIQSGGRGILASGNVFGGISQIASTHPFQAAGPAGFECREAWDLRDDSILNLMRQKCLLEDY